MLIESYINLQKEKDKKEKYFDEVWDLLEKAYAKIGGVKGTDKTEMMQDNILWKLSKKGGKIVACQIYKINDLGRKVVLGGAEVDPETGKATPLGKQELYKIVNGDVRNRYVYAEVSDAMEHIYLKQGAKKVPAKEAQEILAKTGKKVKIEPDGYHYTRMINGEPITKLMVITPSERKGE